MSNAQSLVQQCTERRIAAGLVYGARLKDHEAQCWLGLPKNIEEASANVHSALDGLLDAINSQVRAVRAQHGGGA